MFPCAFVVLRVLWVSWNLRDIFVWMGCLNSVCHWFVCSSKPKGCTITATNQCGLWLPCKRVKPKSFGIADKMKGGMSCNLARHLNEGNIWGKVEMQDYGFIVRIIMDTNMNLNNSFNFTAIKPDYWWLQKSLLPEPQRLALIIFISRQLKEKDFASGFGERNWKYTTFDLILSIFVDFNKLTNCAHQKVIEPLCDFLASLFKV